MSSSTEETYNRAVFIKQYYSIYWGLPLNPKDFVEYLSNMYKDFNFRLVKSIYINKDGLKCNCDFRKNTCEYSNNFNCSNIIGSSAKFDFKQYINNTICKYSVYWNFINKYDNFITEIYRYLDETNNSNPEVIILETKIDGYGQFFRIKFKDEELWENICKIYKKYNQCYYADQGHIWRDILLDVPLSRLQEIKIKRRNILLPGMFGAFLSEKDLNSFRPKNEYKIKHCSFDDFHMLFI
jgi:hypothetical protein